MCTIYTWGGAVGTVRLDEKGRAVPSSDAIADLLDSIRVVEPGTLEPLTLDDGARYLDALPANVAGTYVRAVREEQR